MFHKGNQVTDNYIRPKETSICKRSSNTKKKYIISLYNPYKP